MPSLPALSAGQRPTLIIYPTGGGTGLIGMWKAFDEMEKLGWIGDDEKVVLFNTGSGLKYAHLRT